MKNYSLMLENREGLHLLTFVFLPDDGEGQYPVVLARNPYASGEHESMLESYANMGRSLVEDGFCVIFQNCRGHGGSEGDFIPFMHEREDGLDVLAWIEKQPFFNGNVYLYGGSYLTFVHLSYMDELPPFVKGAYLTVMSANGQLAFSKGGAFKADIGSIWYLAVYHSQDLIHGDPYKSYREEWGKLPLCDYPKRCYGYDVPPFVDSFYLTYDPYACKGAFSEATDAFKNLKIPVFIGDGWAEMFFQGMTEMWRDLPEETKKQSAFLLGPWGHAMSVDENWVYPFTGAGDCSCSPHQWFSHLYRGTPLKQIQLGKINYYHAGAGTWEAQEDFPEGDKTCCYYLQPDRSLAETAPDGGLISYEADPASPPWFPGGPNTFCTPPVGYAKQPEPDFHPGVVSFLSAPLEKDLTICGVMDAELELSTDCESTMFLARLSVVETNGNATVIQDAPLVLNDLKPGEKFTATLPLGQLCWTIKAGERIRLDVSSADSHNYVVHPNLPGDLFRMTETKVAHQNIHLGKSLLRLKYR